MNQENQNQQESFEASQTSAGSSSGSSGSSRRGKRTGRGRKPNYSADEIEKMLDGGMQELIKNNYTLIMRCKRAKKDELSIDAKEFFSREFPGRTPSSIYLSTWKIAKFGFRRAYSINYQKNGFEA